MPTSFREESETSLSMLEGMRRGDGAAWERFVEIFGGVLYNRLRRNRFSPEDAEDVVQEIFRKVQTSFSTFVRDGQDKIFRRWLNSVAQSVTVDFLRKRQQQVEARGGDAQVFLQQIPDPVDAVVTENDRVLLLIRTLEVIQKDFSPQVWQGFWKTQVEGQTSREVAQELGTTPGAVRVGAIRVKERLVNELRGLID